MNSPAPSADPGQAAPHDLPSLQPPPADPYRIPASDPRARQYERGRLIMGLAETAIDLVVLVALVTLGAGQVFADFVQMMGIPWPVAAPLLVAVMATGMGLITLPLQILRGYVWERRFGLSCQNIDDWTNDWLKGELLGILILCVGAMIVYTIMRFSTEWWWLISGLVLWCGFVLLSRVTPNLILPIFYQFEPLDRPELRDRLDAMAARAGLRVEGIYLWKLSEQTNTANAAFTGIGRTRRVILSDTLLEKFSDEEIEAVFAHELGHWKLRHIPKRLAMQGAVLVCLLYAANAIMRVAAPANEVSDLALLPVLGLVLLAGGLIMSPLAMAVSRRFEFQADAFAIRAMGRPAPLLDALRKLAAQNMADPNPPRWIEILFHSHPSIARRIEAMKRCY